MRFSLILLATTLAAPTAFAADLGTYRPGVPYHSVIVPAANVCESQCDGDAQCRGWNYVKPNPTVSGVCEFLSEAGQPISSAIAISGVSGSALPAPDRVIAGHTNTVRVGITPTIDQAPTVQSGPTRRVVTHPVPGQRVMTAPRHVPQPQNAVPLTQSAAYRGPARVRPNAMRREV
ncbi:MAG: hypothetical protein WBA35_05930, partial [Litorimonas sp.]